MKMKIQTAVEEFTSPSPITAPKSADLDTLSGIMKEYGIRHIPIVDQNQIVGLVSDRDIKVAVGLNREIKKMIRAEDIMSMDPIAVEATATLDEVAYIMSENKIGSVLVNDDSGDLVGIFTSTDALNALIEIVRADN
jgi:acetoin utilization protein AcuB